MPVRARELDVFGRRQERRELQLLLHRIEHVGRAPDDEDRQVEPAQHALETPAVARQVVAVHRAEKSEIAVGVEAFDEPASLVLEITRHFETAVAAVATEALLEAGAAAITRHRDGPGESQAGSRRIVFRIVPATELRIERERPPRELGESDPPGTVSCRRREHRERLDPSPIENSPLERLHAAERAADDEPHARDGESVEESLLQTHLIAHRDRRKVARPAGTVRGSRTGAGPRRERSGRAVAAAEKIGRDDEVDLGIERPAAAEEPPHQRSTSAEPVSAWQTTTALSRAAESVPQVR